MTADGEASASEVARWSHGLNDEFLLCRDIGHQCRAYTARYVPEENCYTRTMRCGRCTTERHQSISTAGVVLSGGYSYAEGYVAPKGQGRLSGNARGALRIESIMRLIGSEGR